MRKKAILGFSLILVGMSAVVFGQDNRRDLGIEGRQAPPWGVTEWKNLPEGKTSLDVTDFRGKVLYLYGFQSWCPGCLKQGFPMLKTLTNHYQQKDVAFVAVQTVFEGFDVNTAKRGWETMKRYDLDLPMGHDGSSGEPSTLMRRYRTGGTPWTVIIDKQGKVRYDDFHIRPDDAIRLIDQLRNEEGSESQIETLPEARGGQELLGKKLAALSFDRTLNAPQNTEGKKPGNASATLYRWWTDTCPFCEKSLPAVETLRKKYEAKGLQVVAVYHPKPPRYLADETIRKAAEERSYHGALAVDRDWSEYRRAYSVKRPSATSVSLLVDRDGVIRFVHPGPEFHPSDDPLHRQCDVDYNLLDQAIAALLETG